MCGERGEQRLVQQLVAQPAVEALDEGVLDRLARGDVVPVDLRRSCDQPRIALEVSSVPLSLTIMAGLPRVAMSASSSRATRSPESDVSATRREAFAGAVVDHGQDPEAAAVGEVIGDEVERPALVRRHAGSPSAPSCPSPACGRRGGAPAAAPRDRCGNSLLWFTTMPSRRSRTCRRR